MHCYSCGAKVLENRRGSACGRAASALVYAPFCATIGGLGGSLTGFTVSGMPAALLGGLMGIVASELGARWLLRPSTTLPVDAKRQ